MGESDRFHRNERRRQRKHFISFGADANAVVNLFAINIIFFLILMVIQVGMYAGSQSEGYFYEHAVKWFELPASGHALLYRPWTVISYMFSDTGTNIIRLISNMIWLWAFGSLLQQIAGNDKLIPVYIYGGLTGALFFISAYYFISPLAAYRDTAGLLGANAAVLAIAVAATTLEPDFRFFTQIRNGIPVWILTAIYLLIDFASIAGAGAGYSLSHIGGALAGFVFALLLKKGTDGSIWMNKLWNYFTNLFTPPPPQRKVLKDKVFYNTGDRKPYVKTSNVTQKKVDDLLDKINRKGIDSLTEDEKEFLKKASDHDDL